MAAGQVLRTIPGRAMPSFEHGPHLIHGEHLWQSAACLRGAEQRTWVTIEQSPFVHERSEGSRRRRPSGDRRAGMPGRMRGGEPGADDGDVQLSDALKSASMRMLEQRPDVADIGPDGVR